MRQTDRRNVMRFALGAALLPVLASRAEAVVPMAGYFAPPTGEMLYHRGIKRILLGGASIEVTRSYTVQFEPVRSGFRVEGHQVSVDIQAPANLREYFQLEEERVESGVFPLMLDWAGQIIDGESSLLSPQVEQALAAMNRQLQSSTHAPRGADELTLMIDSLHQAGTALTSQLPRDLFAPVEAFRQQAREIALPWGEAGAVSTAFRAKSDPETGLMREAQRDVVTRLSGQERRMQEFWHLARA